MLPGLGRGAPGTPGRCMPELAPLLNGLFPGRGPLGRIPLAPVNGLFPGRGPAGRGAAALRHWPLQLRVPLALPELLVQQALRVWVLPLPVLPELAEQLLGQVPQRALPSQALGQGLQQALEHRPPDLALPFGCCLLGGSLLGGSLNRGVRVGVSQLSSDWSFDR